MKETIFMIHGMWGSAWYWQNYQRYLEAKGYHCIATTLRYHDVDPTQAPHPELGSLSLDDYLNDLEQEILALGVKPIIMGHSMGGLLAQLLASRGLAKAVVLITPASPAGIVALTPSVIKSFWSILTTWRFWQKPMRLSFDEAVYAMLHLLPASQQQQVYANMVYESGRAAFEIGYWLFDMQRATRVPTNKVTCPILLIAAQEDRITPVSVQRKIADKYKELVTYREFPNHAHWIVQEEGWEHVVGYIEDWLTKTIQ
ncbi:alpha/beta hydrolase [Agitococcus lubricus]|uniref:Pimeloyl-ACP methyl ester carboxylesterase n=1 Tax=Agitococcus lubricus TaxID=1077255 RepID=A0A2T5IZK5_9GAMM|nr:alpha/beta hydrolase [Agitococcus lubricus]PTQ89496.1 pimeloyl-ACP methyl ester carboxylesterase [Agitococcus lubricus]